MRAEVMAPWTLVVPMPAHAQAPADPRRYVGDGRDVLLQGFHWHSHAGARDGNGHRKSWYRILRDNAECIKTAGFTWVWFPPPSDSLSPDGYIPRRWNVLNTAYGNDAELREAIQTLAPVKALCDVVLNHRVGVATSGCDFEEPRFPNNHAAVTRDDSSGVGHGAPDTGEHFEAGRELDHTNPEVRHAIKQYMLRLRSLGFRGWRYDLAKGYSGRFVGEYNDATAPEFSVGEFFDGDRQKLTNWIDVTGGKSAAFDFPTRFALCEACQRDDYGLLRTQHANRRVPGGLIGVWPSRSVTFLDNHDTEHRREHEHSSCGNGIAHFRDRNVALGYAYMLTHPGVPCVFWSHYFDWDEYTRQRIERLIQVRRRTGIHARSWVDIYEARPGLYAANIENKVAVKLGAQPWGPGSGWQLAVDGERFAVWTRV